MLYKIKDKDKNLENLLQYHEIFSCGTIGSTPLSTVENPKKIIDNPTKIELFSFFGKIQTSYQVQLEQINSKIRRRFSDFEWL